MRILGNAYDIFVNKHSLLIPVFSDEIVKRFLFLPKFSLSLL